MNALKVVAVYEYSCVSRIFPVNINTTSKTGYFYTFLGNMLLKNPPPQVVSEQIGQYYARLGCHMQWHSQTFWIGWAHL